MTDPAIVRVLLAEDHTIVRQGLRSLLDAERDIEVVGEAGDGRDAVRKVEDLAPHLVVMDITMPVLNGLEATRQIRKRLPGVQVLILSVHTDEEYVIQALRAGASGYLVKQVAVTELVAAIRAVRRGETFLSASIPRKAIEERLRQAKRASERGRYDDLSDREREVFQLIAEGRPNREISQLLHISVKTVETHRTHIMEKLHIHSTAELVRYAIRKGVIGAEG